MYCVTDATSSMDLKLYPSETAHFFLLACPGPLSGYELREDLILHFLLPILTCATLKQPAVTRGRLKSPQIFEQHFLMGFSGFSLVKKLEFRHNYFSFFKLLGTV